ncbi:alpha/beta hydrolase [Lutibacter holmesii]|uniref:Alpha/beta hydrolase n=1 Tax=Lutibacter holmesii TaxID=1137985 RepID=A0ABW3WM20_9FLAO
METQKTHIYLMPGLAASPKIFEYLKLPTAKFEIHYLEWILPTSVQETLQDYAQRMAAFVTEENPVLVGVSFGGILVQEMSHFLNVKKIILISTIKSSNELPNRLKIIQKTQLYKLFPSKSVSKFEEYAKYAFGDFAKKRVKLYKEYLSVRDELYLNWSIENVLKWNQKEPLKNCVHIHGTDDHIFPIKHIKNCILVKNGTHEMIIFKAKTISKLISEAI